MTIKLYQLNDTTSKFKRTTAKAFKIIYTKQKLMWKDSIFDDSITSRNVSTFGTAGKAREVAFMDNHSTSGWRIASTSGRVRLNNIKQAKNIVWSLSWWSSWDLFRISWGSRTTARVLVCWDFSVPGEECTRFLLKVKKIKDQIIWIQGKINENLLLIHWELYIGRRKSFEIPYLLNYCLCFTSW